MRQSSCVRVFMSAVSALDPAGKVSLEGERHRLVANAPIIQTLLNSVFEEPAEGCRNTLGVVVMHLRGHWCLNQAGVAI